MQPRLPTAVPVFEKFQFAVSDVICPKGRFSPQNFNLPVFEPLLEIFHGCQLPPQNALRKTKNFHLPFFPEIDS